MQLNISQLKHYYELHLLIQKSGKYFSDTWPLALRGAFATRVFHNTQVDGLASTFSNQTILF